MSRSLGSQDLYFLDFSTCISVQVQSVYSLVQSIHENFILSAEMSKAKLDFSETPYFFFRSASESLGKLNFRLSIDQKLICFHMSFQNYRGTKKVGKNYRKFKWFENRSESYTVYTQSPRNAVSRSAEFLKTALCGIPLQWNSSKLRYAEFQRNSKYSPTNAIFL